MNKSVIKSKAKLGFSLIEESILEILDSSKRPLDTHEISEELDLPMSKEIDKINRNSIIDGCLLNLERKSKVEKNESKGHSGWILSK